MSYQISSRVTSSMLSFVLITLLLASPAHAIPVSIYGQQFERREMIILDVDTQLEWFDTSATKGRSFDDVYFDLNHDGGTFAPIDGWRYAYSYEIQNLIARLFAPGYSAGYLEIAGQEDAVASFVNLFGDTWTDLLGSTIKITKDVDASLVVGRSNGIFAIETLQGINVGGFADVNGNQFAIHDLNYGNIDRFDLPDYIQIDFVQSNEFVNYESYSNSQLGSWLVRNKVAVPEPSLAILMLLGGLGLFLQRLQRQY